MRGSLVALGTIITGLVSMDVMAEARCVYHVQVIREDPPWVQRGHTEHWWAEPGDPLPPHHYAVAHFYRGCEYLEDCTVRATLEDLGAVYGEYGLSDSYPFYPHNVEPGHSGIPVATCSGFKCESTADLAVGYAVSSCLFGLCSLSVTPPVFGGAFEFPVGGAIPWHPGVGPGVGYGLRHTCGDNYDVISGPGGGGCLDGGGTGASVTADCDPEPEPEPGCDPFDALACTSECGTYDESSCTCWHQPYGCDRCDPDERWRCYEACDNTFLCWDEPICYCYYPWGMNG